MGCFGVKTRPFFGVLWEERFLIGWWRKGAYYTWSDLAERTVMLQLLLSVLWTLSVEYAFLNLKFRVYRCNTDCMTVACIRRGFIWRSCLIFWLGILVGSDGGSGLEDYTYALQYRCMQRLCANVGLNHAFRCVFNFQILSLSATSICLRTAELMK